MLSSTLVQPLLITTVPLCKNTPDGLAKKNVYLGILGVFAVSVNAARPRILLQSNCVDTVA